MKLINFNTLKIIFNHPLAKRQKLSSFKKYLMYHVNFLFTPYPIIYSFISTSKLIIKKGMYGATGNMYLGLQEFAEMSFLLHFLTGSDLFIDIGANVGSYTILASGVKKAKTVAFEPIPATYENLQSNIAINQLSDLVYTHKLALGRTNGIAKFTSNLDSTNHIISNSEDADNEIEVTIKPLDDLIHNQNPILMKIDVEGFEKEVLAGAQNTLKDGKLKAIIIELNGLGKRYGFEDYEIHKNLVELNFLPYEYFPFQRKLKQLESFGNNNTIYIRDLEFVENRIKNADSIEILGYSY